MEMIIFCGIQGSGKSTFFKENFFKTHVRVSLDLLNTRNRERQFIDACFATRQRFVVDNTNPTALERSKYITLAKEHKFKVIGYFFKAQLVEAIQRNKLRMGKERIPEVGIRGTYKIIEPLKFSEGIDEIHIVEIENNTFKIQLLTNEI